MDNPGRLTARFIFSLDVLFSNQPRKKKVDKVSTVFGHKPPYFSGRLGRGKEEALQS